MFKLIKYSLTNKNFYRSSFKKVSRKRTVFFILFISLIYSFLISPLNTYSGYNAFVNFKKEVNKLPTALEIEIKNEELTSNFSKPLVFNFSNDSVLVVDPENKINSYEKNTSYLVFKQRGVIMSYNNEFSNQEYSGFSDLKLNSKDLIFYVNNITDTLLILILASIYLLSSFLIIIIEIVITVLIFSVIYYLLSKFLLVTKLTFLQICKKLLFLSIYLVVGYAVSEILGIANPYIPITIFGISYFYFIAKNTK